MRTGWAIVGGLVLAAAAYWFTLSADERRKISSRFGPEGTPEASTPDPTGESSQVTRVYRWVDDSGVVNLSDQPPADRAYEPVDIRNDRNIVPFGRTTPEPDAPPEE
ncbi:MAG: hypothetical protein CVV17_03755 [Gammaproteobacteria bacterium HGW-Gammaproteobacteria-7]|nr:MAG: hypothetical protein CVV17_03755 [Gammaproteobacteria bacterium HGW-Gammaproteobacteria-7]